MNSGFLRKECSMLHPRLAVFFDRDGTLNVERGYIRDLTQLELYPEVASSIRRLNDAGVLCLLTTNQTGAARGFYDIEHIHALNNRVNELLLQEAGAHLDAMYYSPYYERGVVPEWSRASDCRKPGTGMVRQAMQVYPDIDLTHAFIVGDKATDVEFARNAGTHNILLRTGYGERVLEGKYQNLEGQPEFIAQDLKEAVAIMFSHWERTGVLPAQV
jgi:D-glycero-D-manno-heptose 1,7-bisphosphate phosphatase